jgi:AbrB family looped-hinge helix DNA binding protein
MRSRATVSTKGQVTLPAAMRAKLGIQAGSHIQFELRGQELVTLHHFTR